MSVRRSNLVEAVPQERRRAVPWALPANAAYFRVWLPRKKACCDSVDLRQ